MLVSMGTDSQPKYLLDAPGRYQILVRGVLDASWSDRLGGMTILAAPLADSTPATLLIGELADQSALVGVLNALHDLGLTLMSVEYVPNVMQAT